MVQIFCDSTGCLSTYINAHYNAATDIIYLPDGSRPPRQHNRKLELVGAQNLWGTLSKVLPVTAITDDHPPIISQKTLHEYSMEQAVDMTAVIFRSRKIASTLWPDLVMADPQSGGSGVPVKVLEVKVKGSAERERGNPRT